MASILRATLKSAQVTAVKPQAWLHGGLFLLLVGFTVN